MPAWKVQVLKDCSKEAWFDIGKASEKSVCCGRVLYWVKAVLHQWDALTNILKTESKMAQSDIDKIKKLENYLEFSLA